MGMAVALALALAPNRWATQSREVRVWIWLACLLCSALLRLSNQGRYAGNIF
jgi:hypothetical protein